MSCLQDFWVSVDVILNSNNDVPKPEIVRQTVTLPIKLTKTRLNWCTPLGRNIALSWFAFAVTDLLFAFAVSDLLLPWVICFCREWFALCFCRERFAFAVTVVGHRRVLSQWWFHIFPRMRKVQCPVYYPAFPVSSSFPFPVDLHFFLNSTTHFRFLSTYFFIDSIHSKTNKNKNNNSTFNLCFWTSVLEASFVSSFFIVRRQIRKIRSLFFKTRYAISSFWQENDFGLFLFGCRIFVRNGTPYVYE